ncbi:TPA: hypothetical protein NKO75_003809 [Vibrio parahaemolyticus]|nr:hypothetical protein [Vibrio parahaemolyticus]
MTHFSKEDWLHNGCNSEKIAKCAAAVHAHEAVVTIMTMDVDEDHYTIQAGAEFLSNVEGQEVLYVEFLAYSDNEHSRSIALIYEKEDLVMYCSEFSFGDDEEEYFESVQPMTTKSFFQYLNTLPNIQKFALPSSLDAKQQQAQKILIELAS